MDVMRRIVTIVHIETNNRMEWLFTINQSVNEL